jgi:hypothetical protein
MDGFTADNTEGFTAGQLAAMNEIFHHNLQAALCDLPNGADGASDDDIAEITQAICERILASL